MNALATADWALVNGRVLAVFGPLLILTGIAGFLIPPRFALMSGAPAYNVFHIVFGMIGTALVIGKSALGIAAFNLGFGIVDLYQAVAGVTRRVPGAAVPLQARRSCPARVIGPGAGGGRRDGIAMTLSISAPTPSRSRRPRCARPWPAPRSATTSTATTRRCTALEERAAELLGKEAALFVPSGHDGQPDRARCCTAARATR